jgi:glycosyltransferase involved in cell wall biosynthesis
MESNLKVSIVTPVYNCVDYIEETILSVLNQSYQNIEYIIIDGGSTDGTVDIIKKYKDKLKYWISEKDCGMYDAINKGFKQATGDVYAYLNADDRYYVNTINDVVGKFLELKTTFVFGDCDFIDEKSNVMYSYKSISFPLYLMKVLNRLPFAQQTCFWTSKVHDDIGGFSCDYKYVADTHFFYSILVKKNPYARINNVLAAFRQHKYMLSLSQIDAMAREHDDILKKLDINKNTTLIALVEIVLKTYNIKSIIKKKLL